MAAPYPRLIIEMEGGLIQAIYCDGIDLTAVPAIIIDMDTDGADEGDLVPYGEQEAYLTPHDITPATDEVSRNVRQAYDNWAEA